MIEFLTGKDYPHICDSCKNMVDMMLEAILEGPDTDDNEAPLMLAGDLQLLCGRFGNGCEPKSEETLRCYSCDKQWKHMMRDDDPIPDCECGESFPQVDIVF